MQSNETQPPRHFAARSRSADCLLFGEDASRIWRLGSSVRIVLYWYRLSYLKMRVYRADARRKAYRVQATRFTSATAASLLLAEWTSLPSVPQRRHCATAPFESTRLRLKRRVDQSHQFIVIALSRHRVPPATGII
jgi:hypothetical protein